MLNEEGIMKSCYRELALLSNLNLLQNTDHGNSQQRVVPVDLTEHPYALISLSVVRTARGETGGSARTEVTISVMANLSPF